MSRRNTSAAMGFAMFGSATLVLGLLCPAKSSAQMQNSICYEDVPCTECVDSGWEIFCRTFFGGLTVPGNCGGGPGVCNFEQQACERAYDCLTLAHIGGCNPRPGCW